MLRTARRGALATIAAMAIVSCAAGPSPYSRAATRALLEGVVAEPSDDPFIAREAYRTDWGLHIRYQSGQKIIAAQAQWLSAGQDAEMGAAGDSSHGLLIPLMEEPDASWPAALPDDAVPLTVLDPEIWQEVRGEIFRSLLPHESHAGVVVSFATDDYFLYADDAGAYHVTLLRYRPDDYRIGRVARPGDHVALGLSFLRKSLAARGITGDEFILSTGYRGDYSLPFLYVDLPAAQATFIQYIREGKGYGSPNHAFQVGRTAFHVIKSHGWDLLVRPVSSLQRLTFLAIETAAGTVQPDWVGTLPDQPLPPLNTGPGMDLQAWEADLDRMTGRPGSRGTLDYLVDGEAFFARFVEATLEARESIRLRLYIFDNDDYAREMADLLKDRSAAGIEVKVLLDGLGSTWASFEDPASMPADYRPPPSVKAYLESESDVQVRMVPNTFLTGDHVKTIVVDGRTAFMGGMNIGREYRYDWHDLMVEVHGPVVDELSEDFDRAWAHAGWLGDLGYLVQRTQPSVDRAEDVGYPMRVLYTKAARSEIFFTQLEAIRRARSYIYIENAYFTDDTLLYELVRARRRGVDVRVVLPFETDRGLITRDNALAANTMLKNGIRVYIYPRMSHLKAAIFDGWVCLGSANLDNLSLRVNNELNLATSEPAAAQGLIQDIFEPDFRASAELTQPFPEKFTDYLLEIIGDVVY